MDTSNSNTFREKQYPGKEAEPLCESIELNADFLMNGIPENEEKIFIKKKEEKTTESSIRGKLAYTVWFLVYLHTRLDLGGLQSYFVLTKT